MIKQANRMNTITSAIFSQVDELRKAEIEKGNDVITLSIGSPDLPPARHIVEAIKEAADDNKNYGYTFTKGIHEFTVAIADWYNKKFGVVLDPETEVHSLIGSQEGLSHISLCLVDPDEVVLIPDPGYPIYSAGPLMAGAELYHMPLVAENNYLPDLSAIPEDILKRAKLMILNYPNNPLAATAPKEFFEEVVQYAKKYSFLICHDFAYSELAFDDYVPDSILSIDGAKDVAVEFHSTSKTYNMAGCRVGYMVGSKEIIGLLSRLKSNFDYGIFYPLQKGAIAAITGSQDCVKELVQTYQRRRDIIVNGFNDMGWNLEMPKASMYVWIPTPNKQSSFDFTIDLLKNTGVAVIPGVAFGEYGEGYIRIALVQPEKRLSEAIERIKRWLK
ncbi:MAG: dapL 1 [Firmicutes bacterium]|nr:dapL 1 [Bacillota bacterium]